MSCRQHRRVTPTSRVSGACGAARPVLLACMMCASSVLLLPLPSPAQQWLFTPEIEIGAHHIDNPRLDEDGDTRNITGGLLDIAAALRRNTETSSVLIRPAAAIYRYTDAADEDSEAFFLDFNADNQGLRNSWRFRGNFRQQQVFRGETTSSEIDDVGIDDSVQTGTGRTFVKRQRDMWRLNPGLTLDVTERTALELDVNYLDVQYDTQELGQAVDYNNSRIDAAVVYALSQHGDLEFGVFASRYDPAAASRETDSAGARARYQQSVSDISSFFIDVGAQQAETQSVFDPEVDISETSFLWNIGYDRQLEVTRWRFDIGQNVTPSGSGNLVERNLYRAIMEHQFQPRWSLLLSAVLMNTDTLAEEGVLADDDRDYLQGRATLAYQITRSWTVEGLYSLTHQDFADIPGDAQEHEVRLSFVYSPPLPTQ